jgi:hypothetical protein
VRACVTTARNTARSGRLLPGPYFVGLRPNALTTVKTMTKADRRSISYLKSGTALVSRRVEALEEPTGFVRNDRRKLFRDIEVVLGSELADLHADQPSQPA